METRTLVVVVGVLAILATLVVGGLLLPESGGSLTEQWVSDTARDNERNHHPVGVGPDGDVVVASVMAVPGSDVTLTDTSCSLYRLAPENGSVRWQEGVPAESCFTHAMTEPAIADIDGDGTLEVAVATTENALVVYAADSGDERFRVPLETYGYGRPTVADLAPAPGSEMLVSDIRGNVVLAGANGTVHWRASLADTFDGRAFVRDPPQVADVDADGTREILVGTGNGLAVLSTGGERLWTTDRGARDVQVVQTDDDAALEILSTDISDSSITALDGATREREWTREFAQSPRITAVADVDGDNASDLFVGLANGTALSMDATTGSVEWRTTVSTTEGAVLAPPVVGSVDGETPSVVTVGRDGTVAVLDAASGEQRASYQRSVPVWTVPTLADIDDDGREEILVRYGDGRVVALAFE